MARAYVGATIWGAVLFNLGGLEAMARAKIPNWDRSMPGVELGSYDPDAITTLATGTVAIVRAVAGTK